jgi:hypothetical protein
MGPMALLHLLKKVVLRIFVALKNTPFSTGFEPNNIWYSGKHAYHYTTEDLLINLLS